MARKIEQGYTDGLYLRKGKTPDKDRFYYKIKAPNGETLHGSTRTGDEGEAKNYLLRLRLQIREEAKPKTPTLRNLIPAWERALPEEVTEKHKKEVKAIFRLYLQSIADFPLDQIRDAVVVELRTAYINPPGKAKRSPEGWNKVLRTLRAWMAFAVSRPEDYGIERCPFQIPRSEPQEKVRPILPAKLFKRFLDLADDSKNPHVGLVLRLMVGLGLREVEALSARWEWVQWDRHVYTPGHAKNRKAQPLKVPIWLLSWLRKVSWRSTHGLMTHDEGGNPHHPQYTVKPLERICRELGIPRLSPHRLRASFATWLADSGEPISNVQMMLRHEDITTTMRYVSPQVEMMKSAQARLTKVLGMSPRPKKKAKVKPVAKKVAKKS